MQVWGRRYDTGANSDADPRPILVLLRAESDPVNRGPCQWRKGDDQLDGHRDAVGIQQLEHVDSDSWRNESVPGHSRPWDTV